MAENTSSNIQAGSQDGRRDYWLQQYATAFTNGDKRAAAVALQFVRQYNSVVARAEPNKQLG
ncbi:MAG TPA: hypothetical protein VM164_14840 [Burkholderiales bacterium]|nr:hypothetical protein [Burkholderiales bacterium]